MILTIPRVPGEQSGQHRDQRGNRLPEGEGKTGHRAAVLPGYDPAGDRQNYGYFTGAGIPDREEGPKRNKKENGGIVS